MRKLLKIMSLSAGVPLTVKSVGWTLLGSVGSLKLTEKSTGCVLITLSQLGSVMFTKQADGVGVGLGGTVAVGVTVAVRVGVTVGVGVGAEEPDCAQYLPPVFKRVKLKVSPPQTIISLPVQTAV
jgi:hypothetical protein